MVTPSQPPPPPSSGIVCRQGFAFAKEWCSKGNGPIYIEVDTYRYEGYFYGNFVSFCSHTRRFGSETNPKSEVLLYFDVPHRWHVMHTALCDAAGGHWLMYRSASTRLNRSSHPLFLAELMYGGCGPMSATKANSIVHIGCRTPSTLVEPCCDCVRSAWVGGRCAIRYHGHSMSDPGTTYRNRDEIASMRTARDPIEFVKNLLVDNGLAEAQELKDIEKDIRKEVQVGRSFFLGGGHTRTRHAAHSHTPRTAAFYFHISDPPESTVVVPPPHTLTCTHPSSARGERITRVRTRFYIGVRYEVRT